MKILAVAPQPFFTSRGTPLSVYYRTLVLAEHGAAIDVLTYGCGKDVDIPGSRIYRIPRLRFLEPVPIGPSWRKLCHDFVMVLWTIGLLLRNRYEVVDAHEEAVFWCRFLKPLFRFKLIYDMHSSLPQQLTNFGFTTSRLLIGLFHRLEDSCLQVADAVITVCPDLAGYALKAGVGPDRHVLIENSVYENVRLRKPGILPDVPDIQNVPGLGERDPVILYAGTFEVYQGIELLVRSFARVVAVRPEVRLVLVGGTDDQVRQVRAVADSLGLGGSCLLTGHVPKATANALIMRAQILVSPRLVGTNTPLKIYQYLASGRPMVATRVWSHTQVLDDSVAWLVEPEERALEAGLLTALEDVAGSASRVRNAQALFDGRYSRSEYERKIRRVLEIVS